MGDVAKPVQVDGRATLRTVAERAGVHPSTASRALNPREASKVSHETVERVRAIATELGYEPNHWARSLRTNRSLTIGMVIPRLVDGVLAIMFEAAEDRARAHGYLAITISTHDEEAEQRRLVERLLEWRVDGLILATARTEDLLLDELVGAGVPLVLMNRQSAGHLSVCGDDEAGGALAARHLLGLGHRRVGLVAGPSGVSTAELRLRGYRRAHAEAGVLKDEDLVVPSSFGVEGGLVAGARLLDHDDPPTAIQTVNDVTAIGVMHAAHARGLRVPEDLSVIGYNDLPLSALLPIPLSSVAIPLEEMGRIAVDLLMELLGGGAPASVLLPPLLRARASTGPPAE